MIKQSTDDIARPKRTVLFVSHKEQRCGVHQFGINTASALKNSEKYLFHYVECSSALEFHKSVNNLQPQAIIYNYHPSTLPWLKRRVLRKYGVPHVEIIHEVTQMVADLANEIVFDYHIAPDPVLLLKNPTVFKTGRLIPKYDRDRSIPNIPTIGSFGFATSGKGFEKLVTIVQKEFDQAIIRLHIPYADFGDSGGERAKSTAIKCKNIIEKPGISLRVSHAFLSESEILDFLAQNSLNAFLYENTTLRGISSVTDYALAVQRPIAVTKSSMFRHLHSVQPSICIEDSSLNQIMETGFEPIERYRQEWNEENLIWDYERILDEILDKPIKSIASRIRKKAKQALGKFDTRSDQNSWIPSLVAGVTDPQWIEEIKDPPRHLSGTNCFNRILDDSARNQYRPCIDLMTKLVPDMMSRKIPEANIQQAFVLDTVIRFASHYRSPKILCVGGYDDTAAAVLKRFGFRMDEVDPILNYDLNTYMSKPSTKLGSFDIIFAISVIEHVRDDERFAEQISKLLTPKGVAILTCDFNDQFKQGDVIPPEDFHMYTKKDLLNRLLPLLTDCSLFDSPQWECPNPDFTYAGYKYTFATFVFIKNQQH